MFTRVSAMAACIVLAANLAVRAETVRVGVVIDGPWDHNAGIESVFQKEIIDLTTGDYDVQFPDELRIVGDFTTEQSRAALQKLLADGTCNMVLAMGPIASYEACKLGPLPKPVVAPFIIDPELQDTPLRDGTSGVENLCYLTSPFDIQRDIAVFRDIHPFQHLVILVGRPLTAAIPHLEERMGEAARASGSDYRIVEVGKDASTALAQIPDNCDAVYFSALIQMPSDEMQKLIDGVNEMKLPSFALLGRTDVARGILYGLAPGTTFTRFARRVALNFQSILRGEGAGTLPVAFSGGEQLTVNMSTARKIGSYPSWKVITEAEVVQSEERPVAKTWTLKDAMHEAERVNLDLAAAARAVEVARGEVGRTRSSLLPHVDVSATGLVVDENRASSSNNIQPERSITGELSASQVLWAEGAWAGVSVQKEALRATELERDVTRLDVTLAAATAYLNVLRTKTAERIQHDNLRLTRENLERARTRRRIGMANPAEVYRWESQIAIDRKTSIQANATRNIAEIEFNRVLRRPLEEPFSTVEADLDDPQFLSEWDQLRPYLADPGTFRRFRAFMVQEGLAASPELAALDAQIAVQRRLLSSTNRSFFSPTLALFGGVESLFWEDGAGTGDTPGPVQSNDTHWNAGISVSLPIFSGGARFSERTVYSEGLAQARLQRDAAAQRIEQRIRSALHQVGSSYAGIQHSREAAEAAGKNLDFVSDAYARGVVSIIDLLDAQNQALTAYNGAANAVYDFIIDMMDVERSIGVLYFLADEDEQQAWYQRLQDYFQENLQPTQTENQ